MGSLSIFGAREALSEDVYSGLSISDLVWKSAADGLQFCRADIIRNKAVVESVAVIRVNPAASRIKVFHSFDHEKTVVRTVEEWQEQTSALAVINGPQYMADPFYMPCALVICDGQLKGPKSNKQVRGMLVAEPKTSGHPRADLLDFEYDTFDFQNTPYTQGVQHWPILLDRKGKIKVNRTEARANRAIVAKDRGGSILFLTTEGDFFTLHGLGQFLKESNNRKDGGFGIETAMNLDGGHEAAMIVKTSALNYSTSAAIAARLGSEDAAFAWRRRMPGVIAVFPRK